MMEDNSEYVGIPIKAEHAPIIIKLWKQCKDRGLDFQEVIADAMIKEHEKEMEKFRNSNK